MDRSVTVDLPISGEGFAFKARRVQFGLSQRELARRAGVSEGTVYRLEKGELITLSKLRRLAPHLELTFGQAVAIMVPLNDRGQSMDPATRAPASRHRTGGRGER
jgi:transcriptional regulator with XRE-family HTH domain